MFFGTHILLYSAQPAEDRATLQELLGLNTVDSGGGWLILALPPAELGVHPIEPDEKERIELYFMCDDIERTISDLRAKNITCSEVSEQRWGKLITATLPSGTALGIYQPLHQVAITRG